MAFSGALTLTDLNDFITPSQACIKPVEVKNAVPVDPKEVAATQIHIDQEGGYYEVEIGAKAAQETTRKLEKAQISLNDCLACSGCITSAESVLITLQSHEEVMSVLGSNPSPESPDHKITVLSISPQTIASLAATVRSASTSSSDASLPKMDDILNRVKAFAVKLGFSYVFDTTFARHIALQEHLREFQERSNAAKDKAGAGAGPSLPMLASACPGWICYAEKAHAEMIPLISSTKSPQQIMGTLVKEWIGSKLGKSPDQIYHVTVMPCYDKKLEASRQDFYNEQYRTRDVDCVITTGELELLMKEKGWDLNLAVDNVNIPDTFGIPSLLPHKGSSSGGWLQSIVDHIQQREQASGRDCSVRTKTIRTSDYEDVVVEAIGQDGQSELVFRGAKCYGFRNLQNIVRKVGKEAGLKGTGVGGSRAGRGRVTGAAVALRARRAKQENRDVGVSTAGDDRPYDYVEVMACPAGCVNGGGQARRPSTFHATTTSNGINDLINGDTAGMGSRWGDREWVKLVEENYWNREQEDDALGQAEVLSRQIITDICAGDDTEISRNQAFRTQYRAVVSDVIGLNVKW